MRPFDVGAAVLVAIVWGLSFVAIKLGLQTAPPFLLTALRFFFVAFPLVFFVSPPKARAGFVALYGAAIGIFQFGLLFLAIRSGMPAGLASLVIQIQVYFTIVLALAFGERPTGVQYLGGAVALAGMVTIGAARGLHAGLAPFLLTLAAAVSWAVGNIVGKGIGRVDAIALVAWSSLVVPAPMLALSFWLEPDATLAALERPGLTLSLCVAALAYGGTLLGFGGWAWLLSKYPAATVTPFALLVPVVGMAAAAFALGERVSAAELVGAALVLVGLAVNVGGGWAVRAARRRAARLAGG